MGSIRSVCVYCGSSDRSDDGYLQAAAEIGAAVAARGWRLVFGAGGTGMMRAVADAALARGAEVVGVMPKIFDTPALAHPDLSKMLVVENMHARKAKMAELSDGFVALPGGLGTFDELFEILAWAQIGLHTKPIGLLNVQKYFDPLLELLDVASREGFIYQEHRRLLVIDSQADRLLDQMEAYAPPSGLARWVHRQDGGA